tara:strand:+ start:1495 stop:2052 length:558 start_codon:yes stop_codon:yes gene_type:complete
MDDKTLNEFNVKMESSLKVYIDELSRLRTGRASPSLLEPVIVDAYNGKMKISELATVNVPEPKLLSIQVWDKGLVANVEKAIRDADLGLNPTIDGQIVRVPLPDLTEERRQELTKVASQFSENAKISIRNIRREAMDYIKNKQKNNDISEDEEKNLHDLIQKNTDDKIKEIDSIYADKEKEILQI